MVFTQAKATLTLLTARRTTHTTACLHTTTLTTTTPIRRENPHPHRRARTQPQRLRQGPRTMTGPLVGNKRTLLLCLRVKPTTPSVKIWSDGTIEQIPHLSNAKDEHVITHRNLNNALSGYSPTNHEHADSEDRNFAALGGQNYTSYYASATAIKPPLVYAFTRRKRQRF